MVKIIGMNAEGKNVEGNCRDCVPEFVWRASEKQ